MRHLLPLYNTMTENDHLPILSTTDDNPHNNNHPHHPHHDHVVQSLDDQMAGLSMASSPKQKQSEP